MKTVRVRVAPSPTGDPHVGTAYIGLFDYVFARKMDGKFVLRIEDTDRARSTSESEQAIIDSMRWLGLKWDEGPDVDGPYGPYRQSERSEVYAMHAQMLLDNGTAYRCFCTSERLEEMREVQKRAKQPPKYDGRCRGYSQEEVEKMLAEGLPFVVRMKVPSTGETTFQDTIRGSVTFANEQLDDQVLLKSDGFPTYHLANVVDDRLMEITHVIRAEEWISSTPKHILLYEAFGWEAPVFCHMPLLRNQDKSKISKRKNPVSLLWYREEGYLPEALLNFLGNMGWSFSDGREIFSLDEMIADFTWDRMGKTGPIFDMTKLDWMNGVYIRNLSPDALAERLAAGPLKERETDLDLLKKIVPLIQERLPKLNAAEFDSMADFFFVSADALEYDPELLVPKKQPAESVSGALERTIQQFAALDPWEHDAMENGIRELAAEIGWKAGELFMTIRIAVTGKKASPPLLESMLLLGKDECLKRMENAVERARTLV